jgi:CheY-like chemotaxis protein
MIGIRLDGLGSLEQGLITNVLRRRLPTFAKRFPDRIRRRAGELVGIKDLHSADTPDGMKDDEDWENPEFQVLDDPIAITNVEPGITGQTGMKTRYNLIAIKKKCRRIVVAILDDLDRSILVETLKIDGYTTIFEARTVVESIRPFKTGFVDLVLVDSTVGAVTGLEFVNRLRGLGFGVGTKFVLLSETPDYDPYLLGFPFEEIIVKPVDYDGLLKKTLEHALGTGEIES